MSPTPAKAPEPTPPPPPKPSDGLARLARERYGKFLDDKQLTLLDEKLASIEMTSKRLQSFKLMNGDETSTDFHVVRP